LIKSYYILIMKFFLKLYKKYFKVIFLLTFYYNKTFSLNKKQYNKTKFTLYYILF
jgi:hypothetical protein